MTATDKPEDEPSRSRATSICVEGSQVDAGPGSGWAQLQPGRIGESTQHSPEPLGLDDRGL
ncbi:MULTISPECIES: hypothetical protein [unclassified Pseudoclavibacter]|uniref:hypothetical protein n=1 Tax=unclassified Pseudoclavibacter TaxID=2615177 RepID=UPI0020161EB4|nr:hypothetical protein [Pseudoclavibacter sp. Marseille-Q4354]